MPLLRLRLDPSSPTSLAEVACPRCRDCLGLHVPDADTPERLLGACARCSSWFLIDHDAELMIPIPSSRQLARGGRGSQSSAGIL